jgi:hypothetical protein
MQLIGSRVAGRAAGRVALVALFACVIAMGALNAALRTDSHHWGLMLSNALDLSEGRIPYKDFIIQYGYFTTLVQSLWGGLFGFSFLSFGILTAMVYCGLLYQAYAVIRHLSAPWVAAVFLAAAFVLHPFPIYPWSDYYAGFFLACAVALLYTRDAGTPARLIIAGTLLGLAVWSRYTYAVAIVPFLLALLIAGRYSMRGWMALFLSFIATNLLFLAVFEYGYGINLIDALAIYREMAEGHGTEWFSQDRIENLVAITNVEDGCLVYLWVATFPLFFEAVRAKRLSRLELGAYAALSTLGLVNLIHAIRIFEYFRVINASFALAIVSFWMIGAAVRVVQSQNSAETPRHGAFIAFFRKAPLILIIPLLLIASFSVRMLPDFPLNTFNLEGKDPSRHKPGIWGDTKGLGDLTHGKVGRVNFSHAGMLDLYRAVASEMCGNGNVYNLSWDNVVGHICDQPTPVRLASADKLLRLHDQSGYQRVYVRGELSGDDVLVSTGRGQEDFLCLVKRELVTPHIEYVAEAGSKYFVRRNCVGKLSFGRGWSGGHRWADSAHAEIHMMNYGNRPLRVKLVLTLSTFEPRNMAIKVNGKLLQSADLIPGDAVSLPPSEFRLLPGDNLLSFDGGAPANKSGDSGPLHLTYNVAIDRFDLSAE